MGILSGLMGNASEIDIKHVEREFEKILVGGTQMPIEKQFKNDKNIYDIQKSLASYVLR
ncbi:MAG: hypothetical protein ABF633_15065 [Clostridium sp.]|uniref:hypothetical protein n=1 Tax=Clostridium sp. TaxID=1506 RepID=UPI0039E90E8A